MLCVAVVGLEQLTDMGHTIAIHVCTHMCIMYRHICIMRIFYTTLQHTRYK